MAKGSCSGGPTDCPHKMAWVGYETDRWLRSLPAGTFPGTMYQKPEPMPVERCKECPKNER